MSFYKKDSASSISFDNTFILDETSKVIEFPSPRVKTHHPSLIFPSQGTRLERERERGVNRRSSRQILFRKIGLPLSPLAKRQWQRAPRGARVSSGLRVARGLFHPIQSPFSPSKILLSRNFHEFSTPRILENENSDQIPFYISRVE